MKKIILLLGAIIFLSCKLPSLAATSCRGRSDCPSDYECVYLDDSGVPRIDSSNSSNNAFCARIYQGVTRVPTKIQPTSTTRCNTLFWFDDNNLVCSKKDFCGKYMYLGLKTFETLSECRSALGIKDQISTEALCGGVSMTGNKTVTITNSIRSTRNVWEMVEDTKTKEKVLISWVDGINIGTVKLTDANMYFGGIRRGDGWAEKMSVIADGRTYMVKAYTAPTTEGIPVFKEENLLASNSFSFNCPVSPTPGACQNLWWFDDNNLVCGKKDFCGKYMYQGLRVFSTQEECKKNLPTSKYAKEGEPCGGGRPDSKQCEPGLRCDYSKNIIYGDNGTETISVGGQGICVKITPTVKPILECNMSINPPKLCPSGYICISNSGMPGSNGTCVKDTPTGKYCEKDSDCSKLETCYQPPMPTCPKGQNCLDVMPRKYCLSIPIGDCRLKKCGDANCDGFINSLDLIAWKKESTESGGRTADFNGDGRVDKTDYDMLQLGLQKKCGMYAREGEFCGAGPKGVVQCEPGLRCDESRNFIQDENSGLTIVREGAGGICVKITPPTPTPIGDCRLKKCGDANCDGKIDSRDRLIWIRERFSRSRTADFNKDDKIDLKDYSIITSGIRGICPPVVTPRITTPMPTHTCSSLYKKNIANDPNYFNICLSNGFPKICFDKYTGVYQGCGTLERDDCTEFNTNAARNIRCDSNMAKITLIPTPLPTTYCRGGYYGGTYGGPACGTSGFDQYYLSFTCADNTPGVVGDTTLKTCYNKNDLVNMAEKFCSTHSVCSIPTPTVVSRLTPTPSVHKVTPTMVPTTVPEKTCDTDADCSRLETCYQPPMPTCPPGANCLQVMPRKYCKPITVSEVTGAVEISKCIESKGDANKDGKATLADYAIWRYQYAKGAVDRADFNCDKKVDITDFKIWKEGFLETKRLMVTENN